MQYHCVAVVHGQQENVPVLLEMVSWGLMQIVCLCEPSDGGYVGQSGSMCVLHVKCN